MKLNCITVDDEPLALSLINSFIEKTPSLHLTASYEKASEAIVALQKPDIQLVFLDIQMAGTNGIEIARMLHDTVHNNQIRIVFSTAHNQFAVESYQVEALDYLLKPFDYEDFLRATHKALQYFERTATLKPATDEEAIYVKNGYQQTRVLLKDIRYIQGMRDYAVIYLKEGAKPIITLITLKSLHAKLPENRFMRVQRSFIIALDSVTVFSGNSLCIDEVEITIGEQYRSAVRAQFEQRL